ncbi:hypothetical protein K474DRAFT_181636 [Panus rudis PR-1116 ss-1]|nr:hypothetical protein K474DRAFT_181636 [Panus rudis PR-1116 ss-1]
MHHGSGYVDRLPAIFRIQFPKMDRGVVPPRRKTTAEEPQFLWSPRCSPVPSRLAFLFMFLPSCVPLFGILIRPLISGQATQHKWSFLTASYTRSSPLGPSYTLPKERTTSFS